jgi:hypothetical protein
MKITTDGFPESSVEATVRPETVSGSENEGMVVPSASICEVTAMPSSYCRTRRVARRPKGG